MVSHRHRVARPRLPLVRPDQPGARGVDPQSPVQLRLGGALSVPLPPLAKSEGTGGMGREPEIRNPNFERNPNSEAPGSRFDVRCSTFNPRRSILVLRLPLPSHSSHSRGQSRMALGELGVGLRGPGSDAAFRFPGFGVRSSIFRFQIAVFMRRLPALLLPGGRTLAYLR